MTKTVGANVQNIFKSDQIIAQKKEDAPWVHLIDQNRYDLSEIAQKLHSVFDAEKIDVSEKKVFLKVSFVFPVRDAERTKMIITNPLLIAATCEVLAKRGATKIFIGDGETFGSTRYAFEMVEIKKAIKQIPRDIQGKIIYAYLDEYHKEWVTPQNPVISGIKLDYPRIVKDVDIFISMPKLKCNVFAEITLSVKNGMGMIKTSTRWAYHNEKLHGMIADIYQIRPPDYVITDAVFAGEGQGPMQASAYPTNLILFGNNGCAVDAISCKLMGYDPFKIKHLKYLFDRGYGPLELDKIRINDPRLLESRKHDFAHPELLRDKIAPNVHCYFGDCCESGCKAFLTAMMDGYARNVGWARLGEIHFILGKNAPVPKDALKEVSKKKIIVYGNCAKSFEKLGRYYAGCPPNYILALGTYGLKTNFGNTPWMKYVEFSTVLWTSLVHWLAWFRGKKGKPNSLKK